MDALQKKLDFARPPVDEVVLSVQFERLNALLAPHLGEIWQEFKKDGFVNIKEQPPVVPTVEKFPKPTGETQLHISNTDLARIWFIHEDDSRLIQVQRDRFTFNWRKTELAPRYPGFSAIFEEFEEFYNRFRQVIEKQRIGDITPLQYELTYINQLFHGDGWDTLDDVGKIYNLFVDSRQSNSFWSCAESMILRTSFPVQDLHGRLHLAISSRVKMPEQRQTLQTDFTMRGFPGNTEHDAMIAWFKTARDRIREKFTSMFTGDMPNTSMGAKTMNTVNWQTDEYYQGAQDQMVPQIVGMLLGHGLQTGSYSNLTAVEVNRGEEEFVRYTYPDSDLGIVVLAATGHASALRDALNSILNQSNAANAAIEPDSLATVPHSFSLDEALQELEGIREEVEETCAVDDDVIPVPESAYEDARLLLQRIHPEIPKPDIMWYEDGGIGLEWRPGDGIATMSLYGDNHVIYGAFFNKQREVEGICSLSDRALLQGFLTTLRNLFQSKA